MSRLIFFGFVSIWEHKTTRNCLFPNLIQPLPQLVWPVWPVWPVESGQHANSARYQPAHQLGFHQNKQRNKTNSTRHQPTNKASHQNKPFVFTNVNISTIWNAVAGENVVLVMKREKGKEPMLSISNLEFSLWKRKKPRLLLVAITWWCGIVWFGEKSEEPRLDVVKGSEQALFTSANQLFWFLLLLLFLLLLPISPFCHMFWWK